MALIAQTMPLKSLSSALAASALAAAAGGGGAQAAPGPATRAAVLILEQSNPFATAVLTAAFAARAVSGAGDTLAVVRALLFAW